MPSLSLSPPPASPPIIRCTTPYHNAVSLPLSSSHIIRCTTRTSASRWSTPCPPRAAGAAASTASPCSSPTRHAPSLGLGGLWMMYACVCVSVCHAMLPQFMMLRTKHKNKITKEKPTHPLPPLLLCIDGSTAVPPHTAQHQDFAPLPPSQQKKLTPFSLFTLYLLSAPPPSAAQHQGGAALPRHEARLGAAAAQRPDRRGGALLACLLAYLVGWLVARLADWLVGLLVG